MTLMKSTRKLVLILSLFLAFGCASVQIEDVKKVKRGMEKTDVMEILQSPYRVFRVNDTDVWVYRFRRNDFWESREIHFRDGIVQFSGEPLTREKLMEGVVPPSKQNP
jgi:outer membrane protein assembly factor BamE (lipoprotein component of BamABCDE complex)